MTQKTQATDIIQNIKIGNKDLSGNLITDVLAKGNEYAVYEIDTPDINKKLRVLIDGIDDESEAKITESYVHVKEKYITAKGLLYRSVNYGLMKNRVAHTLATALSGYHEIALQQFERLIVDINKEYKDSFVRRIFYIAPGYILLTALVVFLALNTMGFIYINDAVFVWIAVANAAITGGVFSLTLNLPKMRFEAEIGRAIFMIFGLERISISVLAGVICTIGIRSKFIMANVFGASIDIWALLFVVIVSAFSEKMVPNIIMKLSETALTNKRPI